MSKEYSILKLVLIAIFVIALIWILFRPRLGEGFGRPNIGTPSSDFEEGPGEGRLWPPNSRPFYDQKVIEGCRMN